MRLPLAVGLLCIAGCATTPNYAKTQIETGLVFTGPRRVALSGGEDDRQMFERVLISKGFRVAKGITDLTPDQPARFVFTIDGVCGLGGYGTPLWIEGFDTEANLLVFRATVDNKDDCPDTFFAAVADSLSQNWEQRGEEHSAPAPATKSTPPPL